MGEIGFQSPRVIEETPLTAEQLAAIHMLREEVKRVLRKVRSVDLLGIEDGEIVLSVGFKNRGGEIRMRRYTVAQLREKVESRKARRARKTAGRSDKEQRV